MKKRVLVIGAGIAGLSTASYLQRNGFDTEIFESHDKPGGLCTSWTRQGYTFDGCIHWLMGSGPSSNLHEIWKELGAGDLEYIEWDVYTTVRLSGGDSFTVYTDPDKLEAEILRLSPGDGTFARAMARGVRRLSRLDLPGAMDRLSLREALSLFLVRFPAALPLFLRPRRFVGSLVRGAKGERVREAFARLLGEAMDDFPLIALYMMLGFMAKKSAGYPLGGSLAFARAIEADYLRRGGTIRYGARVDEIIVEDGRAAGLRGAFGEARGDIVVSAADAHATLRGMLKGRYAHPVLDEAIAACEARDEGKAPDRPSLERYPSLIFIGLGLKGDYSGRPHSESFALDSPLLLEGGALEVGRLGIRIFGFDRNSAPAGKTAAVVMVETGNDRFWTELRERDRGAYAREKSETATKVVAALEAFIPGIGADVELLDVSTPATFARYTGNWHGSYEGWLPTKGSLGKRIPKRVEGLADFHLVGQWTSAGGGLPPAGMDGRNLAKRLCRAEGRRFRPD